MIGCTTSELGEEVMILKMQIVVPNHWISSITTVIRRRGPGSILKYGQRLIG